MLYRLRYKAYKYTDCDTGRFKPAALSQHNRLIDGLTIQPAITFSHGIILTVSSMALIIFHQHAWAGVLQTFKCLKIFDL